jgi:signal peptidase I
MHKHNNKKKTSWRATARSLGVTVFVVLLFRAFVAEAYVIPSGSMEPSLLVGDRLVVAKASWGVRVPFTDSWLLRWGQPERGQVVLFSDPRGAGDTLIKRVAAVGGDRVSMREGRLRVNGVALPRSALPGPCEAELGGGDRVPCRRYREENGEQRYQVQRIPARPAADGWEITVPPGHFFAMGDNRDDSSDSRFFGPVSCERLRGRALMILWSWASGEGPRWSRMGRLIHGD